jgi:sec-independent protein translocase protein TatB
MFDIGFSELLIIAVVALLVLGPERLPTAARFAGLWVRRARAQWYSVKAEFEREIAQDELRKQAAEPFEGLGPQMRALQDELRAPFAGAAPGLDPDAGPGDPDFVAPLRADADASPPAAADPDTGVAPADASAAALPATEDGDIAAGAQADLFGGDAGADTRLRDWLREDATRDADAGAGADDAATPRRGPPPGAPAP